jgi:predicted transglutaminase-like cysteine proteinase
MSLRIISILGAVFLGACQSVPGSGAILADQGTQVAFTTFGHDRYCAEARRRDDPRDQAFRKVFCDGAVERAQVALSPSNLEILSDVHRQANAAIAYRSTTSWDPLRSEGDCKTYAARKQLELLARGFPPGALRLATAFINDDTAQRYQYHAVLLVDTDQGTFVLDNRQAAPRRWDELPYVWMTAQVPGAARWAKLPADEALVAAALARNERRPAAQLATLR